MTIIWPWVVTVCCGVLFKLPAACALARMLCTAFITSCWKLKYASPKDEVHDRFLLIWSRTEGNWVSAFTLGSHDWLFTAAINWSPFRLEFCCSQRSASTI